MKSSKSKTYKALMIDVDGTLIPNAADALPSARVIDAIKKAAKHIHVGLATGRPLFMVNHILDALDLSGLSIIDDGAQIIDTKTKKVYREQYLNDADVTRVVDILLKRNVPRIIIQDDQEDVVYTPGYHPKKSFALLSTHLDQNQADSIIEELKKIPTLHCYKFEGWDRGFGVNITHAAATKQHGILEVAKILDIETQDIIGIGDSYNDFPLLMACGLKVAMGNAVEDLKAVADYIAPSVFDDGVADVIEKFILFS